MGSSPKIKNPKVTFKRKPHPTGLSGVGYGYNVIVKLDKKICGQISGGHWHSDEKISTQLGVEDKDCWNWIFLKHESSSLEDAKFHVESRMPFILEKYKLHLFDKL